MDFISDPAESRHPLSLLTRHLRRLADLHLRRKCDTSPGRDRSSQLPDIAGWPAAGSGTWPMEQTVAVSGASKHFSRSQRPTGMSVRTVYLVVVCSLAAASCSSLSQVATVTPQADATIPQQPVSVTGGARSSSPASGPLSIPAVTATVAAPAISSTSSPTVTSSSAAPSSMNGQQPCTSPAPLVGTKASPEDAQKIAGLTAAVSSIPGVWGAYLDSKLGAAVRVDPSFPASETLYSLHVPIVRSCVPIKLRDAALSAIRRLTPPDGWSVGYDLVDDCVDIVTSLPPDKVVAAMTQDFGGPVDPRLLCIQTGSIQAAVGPITTSP